MMSILEQRKLSIWLSFIYLLAVVSIILFKFPFSFSNLDNIRGVELIPFYVSEIKNEAVFFNNIFYNVLFFIPFGVFICLIKTGWTFAGKVLPIVLLSLSLEILQFVFAIGVADTTDLITNSVGGVAGIGLYSIAQTVFKDKTHKIINAAALVFVVIMLILFCVALVFLKH